MRKIALPATSGITDPAARRFLERLREIVESWQGLRLNDADKLDQVVMKRDLLDLGVARSAGSGLRVARRISSEAVNARSNALNEPDGPGHALDPTPPPAPSGLAVEAGFSNVALTWDDPATLYPNHAVTEVWRAPVDDLAQAERIGATQAAAFTDARLGTNAAGFYWLRFVSKDAIEGDFNATAGTLGATGLIQGGDLNVGAGGASAYVHDQASGSDAWNINHNLGYRPAVTVYSVGGAEIEAEVLHLSANQVRVYFINATAGVARLT